MANKKPIVLYSGVKKELQSGDTVASTDIEGSPKKGYFGASFDGQGGVISTGSKVYFTVPKAGTITGWNIVCDGSSPTCTIDVWKIATGTALPTVSNTIMGTKPALSTGNAIHSTTLTSWTTAVAAGDIFCVNVDAVTVATKLNFVIEISWT